MCGETQFIATLPKRCAARHGEIVRLAIDCENLHIFDKDSEERVL
jgi:hypothetical protein